MSYGMTVILENKLKKEKWRFEAYTRNTMGEILAYTKGFVKRNYSLEDVDYLDSIVQKYMGISYKDHISGKYLEIIREKALKSSK
jgi:hypothetical protein